MALTVNVTHAEDTATPRLVSEDRYSGNAVNNMIAGAIRVDQKEDRDVWQLVRGRDMDKFNEVFVADKVFGNDEDTVRQEITSKYPAAPSGTYRVTKLGDFSYKTKSRNGYNTRKESRGFAVFKKYVIGQASTLDELRDLSVRAGTIMLPRDAMWRIIDHEKSENGYTGGSYDAKLLMNRNGFSCREYGKYFQVRFNPKHYNRKVTKQQYEQQMQKWRPLASGQIPHEITTEMINHIRPGRLSRFVDLDNPKTRPMGSNLSRIKDAYGSSTGPTYFQEALWFMGLIFGKKWRGYRNDSWVRILKKAAPYMDGMRIKHGEFTDRKAAYLKYRRENPETPAKEVFDILYNDLQRGWFLKWLETEFRACGVKIPPLPPEPEMPNPARKKKGKK